MDAGIPMPALVSSMPMPSFGNDLLEQLLKETAHHVGKLLGPKATAAHLLLL
jgi:hypothetical protein